MGTTPSQTNASAQSIARMSSWGTLGGSPEWRRQLPTAITDIMATTELASHDTIDPSNQMEAGSIVGLSCAPKLRAGAHGESLDLLLPAATRCAWSGPVALNTAATRPTSATSAHYVVPTMGAAIPVNTLIWVSGCAVASNNGLKLVSGTPSTTAVPVSGGLTAETFTAAQNVSIEVCGFQFTSGDATMTTSGGVTTFGATSKDCTQLALVAGQEIFIGSPDAAAYAFATAADYGPAVVTSTPVAGGFTVEAAFGQTFASDSGTSKTIRLMFGQTLRVVARTDSNYIDPLYQVETKIEHVGAGDAAEYIYNENCALSTFTLSAPSKALVTVAADFLATDATATETQRTNASTPTLAKRTIPFNTTSDISSRMFTTSDGAAVTGYITSLNLIAEHGASENPAHGVLGSVITSLGKVKIRLEIAAMLTAVAPINAARLNSEVRVSSWMRNAEGAYAFRVPSARAANGQATFPTNQVVMIDLPTTANKDSSYGTSLIVSKIPGCPALPARA